MGRAPGSRAHPLPVPVAGSSLLACSGASVSIVHFKSDPGMSKARCLLARLGSKLVINQREPRKRDVRDRVRSRRCEMLALVGRYTRI